MKLLTIYIMLINDTNTNENITSNDTNTNDILLIMMLIELKSV